MERPGELSIGKRGVTSERETTLKLHLCGTRILKRQIAQSQRNPWTRGLHVEIHGRLERTASSRDRGIVAHPIQPRCELCVTELECSLGRVKGRAFCYWPQHALSGKKLALADQQHPPPKRSLSSLEVVHCQSVSALKLD